MDQLKIAIADKILGASSGNSDQLKQKLDKIQRFNDFAEACKSLMQRYPEIEEELLRLVRDDDFDTVKASRRVNSILDRDQNPVKVSGQFVPEIPVSDEERLVSEDTDDHSVKTETFSVNPEEKKEAPSAPNSENTADPYVIVDDGEDTEITYFTLGEEKPIDDDQLKKRKIYIIILQVLAVLIVLFGVYLAFKFVVNYWKYILLTIVIGVALFAGWKYYRHKKAS